MAVRHVGKAWIELEAQSLSLSRSLSTSTAACTSHLARYLLGLKQSKDAEQQKQKQTAGPPQERRPKPTNTLVDQLIGRGARTQRPAPPVQQRAPSTGTHMAQVHPNAGAPGQQHLAKLCFAWKYPIHTKYCTT
jgi:hypothetical protein